MKSILRSVSIAAAAVSPLALMATTAGATTVSPAGHSWKATSGTTTFISNNGTGTDVTCPEDQSTGVVPGPPGPPTPPAGPAYNYNSLAGTLTGGPTGNTPVGGEVVGPINTVTFGAQPPASRDCTAAGTSGLTAFVDTSPQAGRWTLTADADKPIDTTGADSNHPLALVSVNVPPDAVVITIFNTDGSTLGTLTIPDDAAEQATAHGVAASVSGTWINGTNSSTDPSRLCVRGQAPFTDSIGGLTSQGVEYADGTTEGGHATTCETVIDTTTTTDQPITITTP